MVHYSGNVVIISTAHLHYSPVSLLATLTHTCFHPQWCSHWPCTYNDLQQWHDWNYRSVLFNHASSAYRDLREYCAWEENTNVLMASVNLSLTNTRALGIRGWKLPAFHLAVVFSALLTHQSAAVFGHLVMTGVSRVFKGGGSYFLKKICHHPWA